jgi:5'-nucleotidase
VDGTPADCINLAINGILTERPALVLSGVNHGGNLGDDITYSGTVSAAMEGALLGVPSIAVSLVMNGAPGDFGPAAAFAARLASLALRGRLPGSALLNVNVPARPAEEIRGCQVTRQGKRRYGDSIVEKIDPRGRKYYWIGATDMGFVPEEGTDCVAVESGYISLTPLHLDLTKYSSIGEMTGLELDWP